MCGDLNRPLAQAQRLASDINMTVMLTGASGWFTREQRIGGQLHRSCIDFIMGNVMGLGLRHPWVHPMSDHQPIAVTVKLTSAQHERPRLLVDDRLVHGTSPKHVERILLDL